MNGSIDIYGETESRGGLIAAVAISLALHLTITAVWLSRQPDVAAVATGEPLRYVDLQAPASPPPVVEAPGSEVEHAPRRDAALSDANRQASTPDPRGPIPTTRPGDGRAFNPDGDARPAAQPRPQSPAARPAQPGNSTSQPADPDAISFNRETSPQQPPAPRVDWNAAITQAGRAAAGSNPLPSSIGGEEGFAESGPISFETQWFEWGDYGTMMVAKIRYYWYRNMPDIIRMGMKGVVTIRFTIQRSGQITDIEIVKSSGTPPFDFAARKAIELSSPLHPLPENFPGERERVTASFYYNLKPPAR